MAEAPQKGPALHTSNLGWLYLLQAMSPGNLGKPGGLRQAGIAMLAC